MSKCLRPGLPYKSGNHLFERGLCHVEFLSHKLIAQRRYNTLVAQIHKDRSNKSRNEGRYPNSHTQFGPDCSLNIAIKSRYLHFE